MCWVWVIERKGGKIELEREREQRVGGSCRRRRMRLPRRPYELGLSTAPMDTLAMSCVFCGIATLYRLKLVYVADVYRDSGHQGSSQSFIMYRVFRPL